MATKEPESWITVNGKHIPIGAGETKEEAINKALNKDADNKERQIKQNEEEAKKLNAERQEPAQIEKQYKDADDWDTFLHSNLKDLKKIYDEAEKQGKDGMEAAKQEFYNFKLQQQLKDVKEISIEKALDTIRNNIKESHLAGWFRNADSEYKPHIMNGILTNKGVLNAGLNVAYYNYKNSLKPGEKALDFKTWLHTPVTMWRGTRGQKVVDSDKFISYTTDKKIAAGFTLSDSGGAAHRVKDDFSNIDMSKMQSISIKPIDTLGSYQTTQEQEYLILVSKVKK